MKAWDELHNVQSFPDCSYGSANVIHKYLEEQRLIQLLMGLNDSYKVIRGQILMMKPLPSVFSAYSMILEEKRQCDIHLSSHINPEAIAMIATSDQKKVNTIITCDHCKKTIHTKSQCYRLHGFPVNFKLTKLKRDYSKAYVHNVTMDSSPCFTQEQYQQLLQLLNTNSISSINSSQVNSTIVDGAMNDNGTSLSHKHFAANIIDASLFLHKNFSWIIDYGSSNHMCFSQSIFTSMIKLDHPHSIGLPNGNNTYVSLEMLTL